MNKLVYTDDVLKTFDRFASEIQTYDPLCGSILSRDVRTALEGWLERTREAKPEKTGDQMFREQGFHPEKCRRPNEKIGYRNGNWSAFLLDDGGIEIWSNYNGLILDPAFIQACAQLTRELEPDPDRMTPEQWQRVREKYEEGEHDDH